ncbi:MAG TPA: alpha/beta hydrolase-fold protein [Lacunisphaera sp.]|nr:alpha/beta hydrolase-fold protein [Lacunisphaera sp.]
MQGVLRLKTQLVILLAGALAAVSLQGKVDVLSGLDFGPLEPREVTVYLPDAEITATTPVLIALDGQNMGAWRLAEALAGISALGRQVAPVVVAIPAGRDRIEEYGMADTPDFAGRGKRAAEFQRFVVGTLLPAVRKRYGLGSDPALTGIMGSSLGGLAAFDLAWRHPGAVGFAGMFSGSFWWRGEDGSAAVRQASRLAHRMVRATPEPPSSLRLWFSVGSKEEKDDRDGNGVIDAVQDTAELVDEVGRRGWKPGERLAYTLVDGAEHNEAAWARALPGFLAWALPSSDTKRAGFR